jgi:hypothetical protein
MKLCNLSFILVNDTVHVITFIRTDFAEVNMVGYLVGFMVFNTTFNNSSVTFCISWWSVLLVEETGVHRENHRPAESH